MRIIFRSYLKLGSLNLLMADLHKQGIVTRVRTLKTGETVGGIPFTRGPLAHLLRNRFYIGVSGKRNFRGRDREAETATEVQAAEPSASFENDPGCSLIPGLWSSSP